jgi:hypothetical protein
MAWCLLLNVDIQGSVAYKRGKEMAAANNTKKNQTVQSARAFAAVKSNHELYYQMASIFKQIRRDQSTAVPGVFKKYLPGHSY